MSVESKEPRTTHEVTRRSPWEMAEHLWEGFPRWDWPFGERGSLQEVGRTAGLPMRMEEVRDGDQLVVRAELPGIDPEKDLEVTVDQGVLTISAERRERTEEKEAGSYRSEFRYGHLERQIRLPEGTGAEAISATYTDGVLEVRLPAPDRPTSARRVDVQRA